MSADMLFDYHTEGNAEGQYRSSAVFSPDRRYRYSLARWWSNEKPHDLLIMCNGSIADGSKNDPTITRCDGFVQRNGGGGYVAVNCYGFIATKPAAMWAAQKAGVDIIGPENDGWIRAHLATTTGRVILAWGAHPKPDRVAAVMGYIRDSGHDPLCLGVTKDGQPRHPLMLASATSLRPWVSGDNT